MDNFFLNIFSDCGIEFALSLGFKGAAGGKATHFKIDNKTNSYGRMLLAWHEVEGYSPLPVPMGPESIKPIVLDWLKQCSYGPKEDFDGDSGRGWHIYNKDGSQWGKLDNNSYAFLAIEPVWAEYSK